MKLLETATSRRLLPVRGPWLLFMLCLSAALLLDFSVSQAVISSFMQKLQNVEATGQVLQQLSTNRKMKCFTRCLQHPGCDLVQVDHTATSLSCQLMSLTKCVPPTVQPPYEQWLSTSRMTASSCYDASVSPKQIEGRDCEEIFSQDTGASDGVYTVFLEGNRSQPISVQCDMQGGGWTILLKRFNGSVNFDRDWNQMKELVGSISGEFWLGLEPVHRLTTSGSYSLMAEFAMGPSAWQETYDIFFLLEEKWNYILRVQDFNNTMSTTYFPELDKDNNRPFATRDRDNSGAATNCPVHVEGPGWYNSGCNAPIRLFSPYTAGTSGGSIQWMLLGTAVYPSDLSLKVRRRRP